MYYRWVTKGGEDGAGESGWKRRSRLLDITSRAHIDRLQCVAEPRENNESKSKRRPGKRPSPCGGRYLGVATPRRRDERVLEDARASHPKSDESSVAHMHTAKLRGCVLRGLALTATLFVSGEPHVHSLPLSSQPPAAPHITISHGRRPPQEAQDCCPRLALCW